MNGDIACHVPHSRLLHAARGCVACLFEDFASCIELLARCLRTFLITAQHFPRGRAHREKHPPTYVCKRAGRRLQLFLPAEATCLLCLVRPLCRPQVSLTGVDKYAEGVAKLFNQEESRCGPSLRPATKSMLLFLDVTGCTLLGRQENWQYCCARGVHPQQ